MKKFFVILIFLILVVEVVLFVRLWSKREQNPSSDAITENETILKNELAEIKKRVETLTKEKEELRKKAGNIDKILNEKEREIEEARKAIETLQTGVNARFKEYQKKATLLDEKRKTEKEELIRQANALKNKIAELTVKLDKEIKKKDTTIDQLKQSVALNEKLLGEERETTADLKKQLEAEKGKAKILVDQVKTLTAERDKLREELEAARKKDPDSAGENSSDND